MEKFERLQIISSDLLMGTNIKFDEYNIEIGHNYNSTCANSFILEMEQLGNCDGFTLLKTPIIDRNNLPFTCNTSEDIEIYRELQRQGYQVQCSYMHPWTNIEDSCWSIGWKYRLLEENA